MTQRGRAIALVAIQLALVLTIAGKYLYERKVCPRVWVRTAQFDPDLPMRGRYLALQLAVDACSLPRDGRTKQWMVSGGATTQWRWTVRPFVRDGKLVVEEAEGVRPELTQQLWLRSDQRCERAALAEAVDYFIGDRAKSPFPLKAGQELWVEVTVPPAGPPRPIQLAISDANGFRPLSAKVTRQAATERGGGLFSGSIYLGGLVGRLVGALAGGGGVGCVVIS